MEVLFKESDDEIGGAEFTTPGRLWEHVYDLSEYPESGSAAETQTNLINAIWNIEGVIGMGFDDEVIHVSKSNDASWSDLCSRIEATISNYATA